MLHSHGFNHFDEQYIEQVVAMFDEDGDGLIDPKEFRKLYTILILNEQQTPTFDAEKGERSPLAQTSVSQVLNAKSSEYEIEAKVRQKKLTLLGLLMVALAITTLSIAVFLNIPDDDPVATPVSRPLACT